MSFGALLLLAYAFLDEREARKIWDSKSYVFAAAVFLVFLLLYTLSIATFGWTRHPMLAAMLTVVGFVLGGIAVQVIYETLLPRDADGTSGFVVLVVALLVTLVAAISSVRRGQTLRG